MQRLATAGLVATFAIAVARTALAQPELPDALPKEFACMSAQTKGASKFVNAKWKCVSRCLSYFWKGVGSESDCLPPYGGTTALCIDDTALGIKGAENKFESSLVKACVTGPGADCPECYTNGCGTSQAQDTVQSYEGQADSFVPGIFCERAGAVPAEQKCQLKTANALAKQFLNANRCYKACFVDARSGGDTTTCLPTATDPELIACLAKVRTKAELSIDQYCNDTLYPDSIPECSGYPTGAQWTNLVGLMTDGNIAPTFCAN